MPPHQRDEAITGIFVPDKDIIDAIVEIVREYGKADLTTITHQIDMMSERDPEKFKGSLKRKGSKSLQTWVRQHLEMLDMKGEIVSKEERHNTDLEANKVINPIYVKEMEVFHEDRIATIKTYLEKTRLKGDFSEKTHEPYRQKPILAYIPEFMWKDVDGNTDEVAAGVTHKQTIDTIKIAVVSMKNMRRELWKIFVHETVELDINGVIPMQHTAAHNDKDRYITRFMIYGDSNRVDARVKKMKDSQEKLAISEYGPQKFDMYVVKLPIPVPESFRVNPLMELLLPNAEVENVSIWTKGKAGVHDKSIETAIKNGLIDANDVMTSKSGLICIIAHLNKWTSLNDTSIVERLVPVPGLASVYALFTFEDETLRNITEKFGSRHKKEISDHAENTAKEWERIMFDWVIDDEFGTGATSSAGYVVVQNLKSVHVTRSGITNYQRRMIVLSNNMAWDKHYAEMNPRPFKYMVEHSDGVRGRERETNNTNEGSMQSFFMMQRWCTVCTILRGLGIIKECVENDDITPAAIMALAYSGLSTAGYIDYNTVGENLRATLAGTMYDAVCGMMMPSETHPAKEVFRQSDIVKEQLLQMLEDPTRYIDETFSNKMTMMRQDADITTDDTVPHDIKSTCILWACHMYTAVWARYMSFNRGNRLAGNKLYSKLRDHRGHSSMESLEVVEMTDGIMFRRHSTDEWIELPETLEIKKNVWGLHSSNLPVFYFRVSEAGTVKVDFTIHLLRATIHRLMLSIGATIQRKEESFVGTHMAPINPILNPSNNGISMDLQWFKRNNVPVSLTWNERSDEVLHRKDIVPTTPAHSEAPAEDAPAHSEAPAEDAPAEDDGIENLLEGYAGDLAVPHEASVPHVSEVPRGEYAEDEDVNNLFLNL
jgi:hypothetical protein